MGELLDAVARFDDEPTGEGAKRFVRSLVDLIGLGFHPDTAFEDYVDVESGVRAFDDDVAALLNVRLERAIVLLDEDGNDVYSVGLRAQRALFRRLALLRSA